MINLFAQLVPKLARFHRRYDASSMETWVQGRPTA
jgi:hypothetical protein